MDEFRQKVSRPFHQGSLAPDPHGGLTALPTPVGGDRGRTNQFLNFACSYGCLTQSAMAASQSRESDRTAQSTSRSLTCSNASRATMWTSGMCCLSQRTISLRTAGGAEELTTARSKCAEEASAIASSFPRAEITV